MALSLSWWLLGEVLDWADDALLALSQTPLGRLAWDVSCRLVGKLSSGLLLDDQSTWVLAGHSMEAENMESNFDGLREVIDQQYGVQADNDTEVEQEQARRNEQFASELVQDTARPASFCHCAREAIAEMQLLPEQKSNFCIEQHDEDCSESSAPQLRSFLSVTSPSCA
jgi:hypothetical protein